MKNVKVSRNSLYQPSCVFKDLNRDVKAILEVGVRTDYDYIQTRNIFVTIDLRIRSRVHTQRYTYNE